MALTFPFAAIVGQDDMTLAIQVVAVDPSIGGVLVLGDRGTGKSTAVRALADLLPPIEVVSGCAYRCEPKKPAGLCARCAPEGGQAPRKLPAESRPVAVVDLLIDGAASGENLVEREGLSLRLPARFVLVGSGNPEEGELRPQLLDRFGLAVQVRTPQSLEMRVEVVRRRDAFERDPEAFRAQWHEANLALQQRILKARKRLAAVQVSDAMLTLCAKLCQQLGTDGLRAELTLLRATRALAALQGQRQVQAEHLRTLAPLALRHRLRRNPLDDADAGVRVERCLQEVLAA